MPQPLPQTSPLSPLNAPPTSPHTRPPTGPPLLARFLDQVSARADQPAMRTRSSDAKSWETISWRDYGSAVMHTAGGLVALGIEPGDRVALAADNCPNWHIADLGILASGAVSVPLYPTSSSSQMAYVLADSAARICLVDSAERLAKVLMHLSSLPALERIILFGSAAGFDQPDLVSTLGDLQAAATTDTSVDEVQARIAATELDDLATLVYTSGTTGPPKGTCITHGNIAWTLDAVQEMIHIDDTDRFLSYLPLSHIAERMTSHFGQIAAGGETWFATNLASVPEDLRACRPTIFMAVPRVWQKLFVSIREQLDATPLPLTRLLDGLEQPPEHIGGHVPPRSGWRTSLRRTIVDNTVGGLVRRKLGLDRARLLVSAAAPIHPDLVRWFHGIGLPIAEVYGQTEDCGPATINPPDRIRIGSVGVPIPGLEIDVADDGELRFRGGSVCAGYFGAPEATAQLIDADGWMNSGDLGHVDDDGYVWITGRKKDLIINAAGKNIAPSEIEARLSMECLIGQAVVVGEGRRFLTAVLTLDPDAAADWAREHHQSGDVTELRHEQQLLDDLQDAIDRVNREHAPVEQIKYWRLLPAPLTVEAGDLTPTLKVRREAVRDKYADLIETMYADTQPL